MNTTKTQESKIAKAGTEDVECVDRCKRFIGLIKETMEVDAWRTRMLEVHPEKFDGIFMIHLDRDDKLSNKSALSQGS